jgi:hypothetical protein
MSFETLKEEELLAAAEMLAVDLETSRNNKGKINAKLAAAAFAEEGVTWDIYTTERNRLQAVQDELIAQAEEEKRLEEQRNAAVIREQDVLGQDDDVEPEEDEVFISLGRALPQRKRYRHYIIEGGER